MSLRMCFEYQRSASQNTSVISQRFPWCKINSALLERNIKKVCPRKYGLNWSDNGTGMIMWWKMCFVIKVWNKFHFIFLYLDSTYKLLSWLTHVKCIVFNPISPWPDTYSAFLPRDAEFRFVFLAGNLPASNWLNYYLRKTYSPLTVVSHLKATIIFWWRIRGWKQRTCIVLLACCFWRLIIPQTNIIQLLPSEKCKDHKSP